MADKKISLGMNIVASENVTKALNNIKSALQKVYATVRSAPKTVGESIASSTRTDEALQPTSEPKPSKRILDKSIDGGGFGALLKPAEVISSGFESATVAMKNFLLLLAASGGVTYGIKRFSDNISDSVINLNRLSARTGLPTKDIRELGFISRVASVPVETLGQALSHLSDAQFDKKFGIPSEAVKALSALNSRISRPISLMNEDGTRANLKKVFFEIIRGLGEIKDPSLKAKVSTPLLGSEEILKFGDMGQSRLQALLERFKVTPLGKDLTEDTYRYSEAVASMDKALETLKFTAGSDILRGFTEGLEKSSALIERNSGNVEKFSKELGEKLPAAIPIVFKGLNDLTNLLEKVDEKVGLVKVGLGLLSSYAIVRSVILVGELTKAITVLRAASLSTTIGALTPPALVAGAVGAAGYGIYKLRETIANADNSPGTFTHTLENLGILVDKKKSNQQEKEESTLRVIFENAPTGMRVIEKNSSYANIITELGLNYGG